MIIDSELFKDNNIHLDRCEIKHIINLVNMCKNLNIGRGIPYKIIEYINKNDLKYLSLLFKALIYLDFKTNDTRINEINYYNLKKVLYVYINLEKRSEEIKDILSYGSINEL